MAVTSALLSVAEFSRLPEPTGGIRQELHHGELVESLPPKMIHTKLQENLRSLLARLSSVEFGPFVEFPFRPEPEYEVWVADVAVVSLALREQTGDDEYYYGVPAIVIEVLSPSNSASEMLDREQICLRNGGREFWLVDPRRESVKVTHADGHSSMHGVEGAIESAMLSASIAVREIFRR